MERCTVFRRLTLLCLLKASLLYLIDDVEAAASSSTLLSLPKNKETAQLASFSSSLESKAEASALMEADREERLSFFTVPPMYKKKKRRRTQIQRHGVDLSTTERTTLAAAAEAVKTSSATKDTITEKMDAEYAFENGTDISTGGNKTVSSGDKLDPPIEVEDNFCPSAPLGRAVVQSTLPALILLLNIGVHFVAFVLLLYWWKTVYYEVGDPYPTISPYGYAPATTPLPQRRFLRRQGDNNDDPLLVQKLKKSLDKYNKM